MGLGKLFDSNGRRQTSGSGAHNHCIELHGFAFQRLPQLHGFADNGLAPYCRRPKATMNKVFTNAQVALQDVLRDGMTLAIGGFGIAGIPHDLVDAVRASGVRNLFVICGTAGTDDYGVGALLQGGQVSRLASSYVGENKILERQFLSGQLQIDFTPQGTLAEKLRAGGAGIPAFYTKTGVGTVVAEGKETREFNGEQYLLETSLFADVSLVKAWKADQSGNLVYRYTARNFNPNVACASHMAIVEVETIVENGAIAPDAVHTPGIYTKRLVLSQGRKPIENLTFRKEA